MKFTNLRVNQTGSKHFDLLKLISNWNSIDKITWANEQNNYVYSYLDLLAFLYSCKTTLSFPKRKCKYRRK